MIKMVRKKSRCKRRTAKPKTARPRALKCKVLKGKVKVAVSKKTNRVKAVWSGGLYHTPKNQYNAKGKRQLNSCVRLAGRKSKYYSIKL